MSNPANDDWEKENRYPTPEEWVARFESLSHEDRLKSAAWAIQNWHDSRECFLLNHAERLAAQDQQLREAHIRIRRMEQDGQRFYGVGGNESGLKTDDSGRVTTPVFFVCPVCMSEVKNIVGLVEAHLRSGNSICPASDTPLMYRMQEEPGEQAPDDTRRE